VACREVLKKVIILSLVSKPSLSVVLFVVDNVDSVEKFQIVVFTSQKHVHIEVLTEVYM
jgi:hypothetical protein